jgi:hypothetical protein
MAHLKVTGYADKEFTIGKKKDLLYSVDTIQEWPIKFHNKQLCLVFGKKKRKSMCAGEGGGGLS